MSDINEAIQNLLSDPESGEKIKEIMSSLGGGGGQSKGASADGFDIAKIMRLKSAYDSVMSKDDPRVTLLTALRPYLNPARNSSLEMALKMLNIGRISSVVKETDILKEIF